LANTGIFIEGIPQVEANIAKELDRIRKELADALYEEAKIILAIAKERVPVLTGQLKNTGTVHTPVVTDKEITVRISFGSEVVDWAVPVHERMYVKHVSGQSKYLESVILERMDSFSATIGAKVYTR
jgi:hypothetical protein